MRRALFIVSEQGNGHRVRCGALADELRSRGWVCEDFKAARTLSTEDVYVVDLAPGDRTPNFGSDAKVVYVTDGWAPKSADMVVNGNAGATEEMYPDHAGWILAGPEYALLRKQFRERRELAKRVFATIALREPATLDLRTIEGVSADDLAGMLYSASVTNDTVVTYGGMRALEAACVLWPSDYGKLTIEPRNEGEELNAKGLVAGREVDGLGCQRVADGMEELF